MDGDARSVVHPSGRRVDLERTRQREVVPLQRSVAHDDRADPDVDRQGDGAGV